MSYLDLIAGRIAAEAHEPALDAERRPLFLMYAVLALTRGADVSREDVHHAWVAWMALQGHDDHPSMVPFNDLPESVKAEDEPYVKAIRQVAREFRQSSGKSGPDG